MKRKWMSRRDWRRILVREDYRATLNIDGFKGYTHLLKMISVRAPLWTKRYLMGDGSLCLADDGYVWLMLRREDEPYVITAQFNQLGEWIQIYVDIIDEFVPTRADAFFMDIYLDVIMLRDGRVILDDEDELEHAYAAEEITKEQFDRATATAEKVMADMQADPDQWIRTIYTVRDHLLKNGNARRTSLKDDRPLSSKHRRKP